MIPVVSAAGFINIAPATAGTAAAKTHHRADDPGSPYNGLIPTTRPITHGPLTTLRISLSARGATTSTGVVTSITTGWDLGSRVPTPSLRAAQARPLTARVAARPDENGQTR
jgi:hypothetical protein